MKSYILSVFLMLALCSSTNAQTQNANINKCFSPKQIIISKIDKTAIICVVDTLFSRDGLIFYLRRNYNEKSWSVVSILIKENSQIKFVTISDSDEIDTNRPTIFLLDGRRFNKWMTRPNPKLLEKHRRDIKIVLDTIDEYNKDLTDLEF
jgi:hypothetical protein